MRFKIPVVLATAFVFTLLSNPQNARAESSKDDLVIEGEFSISAPAAGFKWAKMRESGEGEKRATIYAAIKERTPERAMLIVEHRTADTDAKKLAVIKAAYNAAVESAKRADNTDLKGTKPSLETPVPKKVTFVILGKSKSGSTVAFAGAVVFGKNVYQIHAVAESEEGAKKLLKVAESIKE